MSSTERDVLIHLLERVREIEKHVTENTKTLLSLQRAFCYVRREFEAEYNVAREAVEHTLATASAETRQNDTYDNLIQRLKSLP